MGDNIVCGRDFATGSSLLFPEDTYPPHLKGIYLSIETYIPLIRNLYTFCAVAVLLWNVVPGGVEASQQWGAANGIGAVLQYFATFAAAGRQKRSVYP